MQAFSGPVSDSHRFSKWHRTNHLFDLSHSNILNCLWNKIQNLVLQSFITSIIQLFNIKMLHWISECWSWLTCFADALGMSWSTFFGLTQSKTFNIEYLLIQSFILADPDPLKIWIISVMIFWIGSGHLYHMQYKKFYVKLFVARSVPGTSCPSRETVVEF